MKIGYSFSLKVRSFDEKRWVLNAAFRAGVARCDSCDKPAVRMFWQDQEEWYLQCGDHSDAGEQWTGSTRGRYPRILSFPVISEEAAEAWMQTNPFGETRKYRIREYDRTNYYDLMFDDMRRNDHLIGESTAETGCKVKVYPLTDGRYAYEIEQYRPRYSRSCGLVGGFETEQAALDAAMGDGDMPEYLKPKDGMG